MSEPIEFNFGNDSIAKAYDTVLVPSLFEPWAQQLIIDNGPWTSSHVLDLACGTGVVTKKLLKSVGDGGRVIALDMNSQMLNLAKLKCYEWTDNIQFIEGTADSLDIPNDSMDRIVSQQGFQFFPDKKAAANEIYRVLKPGGKAILSTWCSVSDCEIFGVVCSTLESMNLHEISQMMRVPFDVLTQEGLLEAFVGSGFSEVKCSIQEKKLFIKGGIDEAIRFIYATPIGPKLAALASEERQTFSQLFLSKVEEFIHEDGNLGSMASNFIHVEK